MTIKRLHQGISPHMPWNSPPSDTNMMSRDIGKV